MTAAWPTINNIPHLGTILHLLSADVIKRYLQLLGEDVIAVTGSDAHGTPILLAAEEREITAQQFSQETHETFVDLLHQWNIDFDNYTITTTDQHREFVQEFYEDLFRNNKIEEKTSDQYFCLTCNRFLPDRFVIGTCPVCQTNQARGDQCSNDDCGTPLTPFEIINPICTVCHQPPEERETTHWYFKLKDFEYAILDFLSRDELLIPNSFRKEAQAFVERGLDNRALTRDLSWGIPAHHIFGSDEDKVFYVWSEDVLGYISATLPVYRAVDRNWQDIWQDANTVYCLGKDNLFYHAIWFPALQLASSFDYSLPSVLSITNFIQFDGQGFSKSKNIGVWADNALEYADSEYWRLYLIANRPEKRDGNFTWEHFVSETNKILADTIGNLVIRSTVLFHKLADGKILSHHFSEVSNLFIEEFLAIETKILDHIDAFELKSAFDATIDLAKLINNFLEIQRPWKLENTCQQKEILYTIYLSLVRLSQWLSPVLPKIGSQIQEQLGLDKDHISSFWDDIDSNLPQRIPERQFFVNKLDLNDFNL